MRAEFLAGETAAGSGGSARPTVKPASTLGREMAERNARVFEGMRQARERLSPSLVYCLASGTPLAEGDEILSAPAQCCTCAAHLPAGEPVAAFRPAVTFMDVTGLVQPCRWQCRACVPMFSREWMQTYACSYACSQGVFSLASRDDLVRLALDPPAPPFVAIMPTAMIQHLVWRAPVNWSAQAFTIRRGETLLDVRVGRCAKALGAWRVLEAMMARLEMSGPPAKINSVLDGVGMVRLDVARRALDSAGEPEQRAVDLLNGLELGDWFVLNALRARDGLGRLPERRALALPDGWRELTAAQRKARAEPRAERERAPG